MTERNIYVAIATATLLVASGFPVCIVQFVHKAFVVLQGRETNSIYIIRSHPHPTPTHHQEVLKSIQHLLLR